MQHVSRDHIRRTVEAYVDDIVVKTRKADDLVHDLHVAFDCLWVNGVKLNPKKCVFGVPCGMLMGYIVSQRGIRSNLLTQNVHLAPSTQQAEQAGFTRAKNHETCQSIFPEN
jgi:hypothetical protein